MCVWMYVCVGGRVCLCVCEVGGCVCRGGRVCVWRFVAVRVYI